MKSADIMDVYQRLSSLRDARMENGFYLLFKVGEPINIAAPAPWQVN